MVTADIWVEGKADQKFMADLLKIWFKMDFDVKRFAFKEETRKIDLRIRDLGGKTTFLTDKNMAEFKNNVLNGVKNLVILDADDIVNQRVMIAHVKEKLEIDFPIFLLPDDNRNGELENLLEEIIHPNNQTIFDCWNEYEKCLKNQENPTRTGHKFTIPAKKSKIYSYLEVLMGESDAEKELVKDPKRDFTNQNHWILDDNQKPVLKPLKAFLQRQLSLTT
jgi:hypothetical protein